MYIVTIARKVRLSIDSILPEFNGHGNTATFDRHVFFIFRKIMPPYSIISYYYIVTSKISFTAHRNNINDITTLFHVPSIQLISSVCMLQNRNFRIQDLI